MRFIESTRKAEVSVIRKIKKIYRKFFKKENILQDFTYVTSLNKDLILSSNLFDDMYYLSKNSILEGKDAEQLVCHYLSNGWKENLDTSSFFSCKAYRAMYPDTKHMPPLLHYLRFGCNEGRSYVSVDFYESTLINDKDRQFIEDNKKQNKKIILIISHEMSNTGAPRACMKMAQQLQSEDTCVVTWALKSGPLTSEYEELGLYYKVCTSVFAEETLRKNDAIFIKKSFDLVLLNTICTIPLIRQLRPLVRYVTCWIHDGEIGFQSFQETKNFKEWGTLFDKVFVVGDYAKMIAKRYFPQREMCNLLYGIDDVAQNYELQINQQSVPQNYTHYLLAGSIEKRKGQDLVVESLKYLPKNVKKQVRIHVVGANCENDIYEKLVSDRTNCIVMHGAISHNDLLCLMSAMDILLCPSLDDPMPIVATEAMMLSKPVIVTESTGTSCLLKQEDNVGFVIKTGDSKAIADIIIRTFNSKERMSQMGKSVRRIYDKYFTMEVFSDNVRKHIYMLLQS